MSETRTIVVNRKENTNVSTPEAQKLVLEFQEFYLDARKSGRADQMQIFRDFRKTKELEGVWFNPYRNMLQSYFKRWEQSLPFHIKKVPVRAKDTRKMPSERELIKDIAYHDLEDGSKGLQALLIQDAKNLIDDSNEEYKAIDEGGGVWSKTDWAKVQLARKKLALGIATEVMKGTHKHQLIGIKKNAEGRENAGFIMDMIRKSAAGEVSQQELEVLESAIGV